MAEPSDYFPHLDGMNQTELLMRRTTLLGEAPEGDYMKLSDASLSELFAINRALRKKNSGPPKVAKVANGEPKPARAKRAAKGPAALDSLA